LRLELTGSTFLPGDQISLAIVASGQGLYYGLAPDDHGAVWAAARCSRVSDALPTEAEEGKLVPLSADTEQNVAKPPRPLRDLHDIAIQRGALWSVCSYDDTVAIYSLASQEWTRWQPLATDPLGGPDQFHLNTLYFEEELVWVLAHRRGPSWLMAFPVEAALQGETIEPVEKIELGEQAHNIWRQPDGELCTCSSIEGLLLGEHGWRLETGGFPRGVAKLTNGWVVGISELKERRERDFSDARLRFYHPNWEQTHEITLPGVGMVLDLLPIPRSQSLPNVGTLPLVVN
jgi:hypothetical protein